MRALALADTSISNGQIWLELTERGFVDIERARATIVEAHRRGYRVAIDDFGTGYSSLQYLQSLPLDEFLAFCRTMADQGRALSQTPGSASSGNERSGSA